MKQIFLVTVVALAMAATIQAQTVNRVEYFFNTDPGFGNGTAVSLTPAVDIANFSFNANIAALINGLHRLFVRSQRSDGVWSITNTWMFFKSGQFNPVNINRLEYFFDTDPGFGNGTAVAITPATNVTDLSFNTNISSLSLGLHNLFIRTQSNDGAWSQTNKWLFYKASFAGAGNVSQAEYFFDTDPGFGNGTAISFTPSTNIADHSFNVNVGALSSGTHRIFIRTRDAAGNWSITGTAEFTRIIPLPVNWLSFDALRAGNSVQLSWKVANEINNDHYEVEFSSDGMRYRSLGTVATNTSMQYSFTHSNPGRQTINHYRIKQVDTDGKFSYSDIRSVRINDKMQMITATPNPVVNTLEVRTLEKDVTVSLFELMGRKILTQKITGNITTLQLQSLSPGNYLLVADKDGMVIETIRIVKQ